MNFNRGRWTLTKDFLFEAAHQLHGHDGKCARLHGHSFKLTVFVSGYNLQKTGPQRGMLMDYGHISGIVKPIVDEFLDHHFLNETLQCDAPTSEFLARFLFYLLAPRFTEVSNEVELSALRIAETCTSGCLFQPPGNEQWTRGVTQTILADLRGNGEIRQAIINLNGGLSDETLRSQ